MPNATIKSIADKSGKSMDDVEKIWDDAKKEVKDQYDDIDTESDRYWKLVTTVAKRMAGITKSDEKKESADADMSFTDLLVEERNKLDAVAAVFVSEEEDEKGGGKSYWVYKDGKPVNNHETEYSSAEEAGEAAKEMDEEDLYIVEYDKDKEEITDTMNVEDVV